MIGAALQKAIHDALKASPALVGGRVYDAVPAAAVFPYVTIGDEQIVDDGNSCDDGWEVFADVHVWSRAVGFPEAKGISTDAISRVRAINAVTGFEVISAELRTSRPLRDPDGLTSHIVCTFRFLLNPA